MRRITLSVVAVVASACASAPGGSRGACPVDMSPAEIALDHWMDSTGATAEIDRAWIPSSDRVYAHLRFDTAGVFGRAWIISRDLSDAAEERYADVIARAMRDDLPRELRLPVPILIGTPEGPELRTISELPVCQPSFRNPAQVGRMIGQEAAGTPLNTTFRARVYAFVQKDGRVRESRIEQPSGMVELDLAAIRVVERATFNPANAAGIPVEVWASFPVTFRQNR